MPQSRSSSADSKRSAAAATANSKRSSNNSKNVLSRMLGSFRRSSSQTQNANAAANSKEDPNWAHNYKITHLPDRPRQDKRLGPGPRVSVDVIGQLNRIWKYNISMAETKRKEKAAKNKAFAPEIAIAPSGAWNQSVRAHYHESQPSQSRWSVSTPGSPPVESVPNFSRRKATSPVHTRNRWHVGSEAQSHRYGSHNSAVNEIDGNAEHHSYPAASSPSSMSTSSGRMTIRVGLEVEDPSPYNTGETGGLKMRPGGAETGAYGYSYSHARDDDVLPVLPLMPPPLVPKSLTPLPILSRTTSPFLSPEAKEGARRPQRRTLSQSLQPPFQGTPVAAYQAATEQSVPRTAMQVSSAREKALRRTLTPHISTDRDSTPGLVVTSSSPVSEDASPVTPSDGYSDGGVPSPVLLTSKACPVPLCNNLLVSAADRRHNLCADCRSDLQPRQSIFISDVFNPDPDDIPSNAYTQAPTSVPSRARLDSTSKAEKRIGTSRYINGEERKTRSPPRVGSDRSAHKVRATGSTPPSASPRKKRSGKSPVYSRFNKDRSEFRLQPAPSSRKVTRRGPKSQLTSPSAEYETAGQKRTGPLRGESKRGDGGAHIGFQLAPEGAGTATPNSRPQTLQRKPSGPLLEPKVYRPPTPIKKRTGDGSATQRGLSESRRRAGSVKVKSSVGRASSSARAHAGKTGHHRVMTPRHNVVFPKSPGQGGSRHHAKQHFEHRAMGQDSHIGSGRNMQRVDKGFSPVAREATPIDERIYREIDSIIDYYLRVPGASDLENEKRKAEAIALYFAETPLDVEMKIKGFI